MKLEQMNSLQLCNLFLNKTRWPRGILKWREDLELSDKEIENALISLHRNLAMPSDRSFQYKILKNILPTNEYLYMYRVSDSKICSGCSAESDAILHALWNCRFVVPYLDTIFTFLTLFIQASETTDSLLAKPRMHEN